MIKKSLVSILIVNWNEKDFIKDCFESLSKQNYKSMEIIVVDNASTDGSLKLLQSYSKRNNIKLIESKENLGFTGGNNLALKSASGEYILLLNLDTKFDKKTVSDMVGFMRNNKRAGVVQPKLVFMSDNNKLDNVATYLTPIGIPYYFGLYKDARDSKYNKQMKVYSTKGACMMVRRRIINKIGFLDDYMFTYYEESDFCHRVWLAGYECWYIPEVVVQHFVGATFDKRDNLKTIFMGHRNRIRSFIKNFEPKTLAFLLPVHILVLLGVSLVEILRGDIKKASYIIKSIWVNLLMLPATLKERKKVQNIRAVSDNKIHNIIFRRPGLSYYLHVGGDLANYID